MTSPSEIAKCDVCQKQPFKYRCPCCSKQTCSLTCVKQHKNDTGCSGVRNKTAFVAVDDFSDLNLLNDYRLLEDTARVTDKCKRDPLLKHHKSRSLLWLTKETHKRHIHLKSLPYNMERRKHNTSIFNFKSKLIQWDVSWVFPQAGVSLKEERMSEDLTIMEAFQSIFNTSKSASLFLYKLNQYRNADPEKLCFLMKAEMHPSKDMHYYTLQADKTFLDNLYGKTLLEHPVIHVIFAEEKSSYLFLINDNSETAKDKLEETGS
ncbi:box C/D snoRNA protein 1 [Octopus sinensis]|uniref:Box C/D snoRNA protein 1 n=1 Tax=Octopus sinensis TaxID=2607531 RepID=A0A6P7TIZ3_9MOLL|nr:box C/D snoRNA protein 1 [Octopus sinensis]